MYSKCTRAPASSVISDLTKQDQEELIKVYLRAELDRGFVVSDAPLWRMSVFKLGGDNYVFIFEFHHAIIDGWSTASFMTELNNLYLKLSENINYEVALLKSNYKDFIVHHEMNRKDDAIRSFWQKELSEYERLDLFTDQEESGEFTCSYDNEYLKRVEHVAKTLNTTVKVVSLSAYLYMLKILSYSTEIVTGLVTNTRPTVEDGDKILGCFLNSIPLKVQVDGNQRCCDFILNVHEKLIELKNNELLSTLAIASICEEKPGLSNPFFDVLFNYIDFHVYQDAKEDESKESNSDRSNINLSSYERTNTFFDLTVSTTGGEYDIVLKATKKLKSGLSLEYVGAMYFKILDFILSDSQKLLKDIDYLSQDEKYELLVTFNDTNVDYPKNQTIVDLFEEQVVKNPNSVAVVFEHKELSYQELDEQSNQLAHYLQKNYTIKPDDLVGIKQQRSEWMIISILGVLKSGGAYVPIDPEYPQDRIEYIEKDTKCKVCIDEVELNKFKQNQEKYSKEKINSFTKPHNLAYVIYTSGTTGQPKGVMIEHTALVNLCFWHKTKFSLTKQDRASLYAGVAFDASVWELFPYIISGARLYIVPQKIRLDSNELSTYYEVNKITISFLPTQIAEQFLEVENKSLRYLLIGGEKFNHFVKKKYQLINNYGPTESTVVVSSCEVNDHYLNIPIGKPISNTQIYIVNTHNELQPINVIGEICIGGVGLSRGYLNQEELTKEKFIENPFKEGERNYRTGDLGRWTKEGNVEFIGRKDGQVKIRGYRIELAEIENALRNNKEIEEAVVVVKENQNHEKELVAYITAKEEQNINAIRSYLKEILPEHMLPAYYVQLEIFPLTPNGKIDRKSLPDPQGLGLKSGIEYVGPRNEIEERLVKIWQEVLQRENIGIKDDFFTLGGHSLKAVRLNNEYQKELSVKLSLKDLFAHTNIESHAELIDVRNWVKVQSEHETLEKENIETFNF